MPSVENLISARIRRNDEFYTLYSDVEAELVHYDFKGKTVYCNCDNLFQSAFCEYFVRNFDKMGLRRLLVTNHDDCNYYDLLPCALRRRNMPENGDFRSKSCLDLLRQCDVAVTNPPFSLFRAYVDVLMRFNKKFLVVGSLNAVTYKYFFPLLQGDRVWLGHTRPKKFREPGGGLKSFGNIVWYTNLDTTKRHSFLELTETYAQGKYLKYDNYDAIECPRVKDIPFDYNGVMGVPITFIEKYCPEQFEILGLTLGDTCVSKIYENAVQHNKDGSTKCGNKINLRAEILTKIKPEGQVYYTASNANGYLLSVYPRILIRRR